jgi:hypothetical protein
MKTESSHSDLKILILMAMLALLLWMVKDTDFVRNKIGSIYSYPQQPTPSH